jgi:hypothetical protein
MTLIRDYSTYKLAELNRSFLYNYSDGPYLKLFCLLKLCSSIDYSKHIIKYLIFMQPNFDSNLKKCEIVDIFYKYTIHNSQCQYRIRHQDSDNHAKEPLITLFDYSIIINTNLQMMMYYSHFISCSC